ncbi:hypothetical protein COLO4_26597 [Corchorus olitorius]|uniref:Pentatricopeptide repeat-containing protein n=1 Tax=Corchorus olitorius TaxID=93759 RepID=A0A1R3HW07_9ROSI|nr:hypothetical protein COLO4_26597 [Corchorus olitorius]
MRQKGPIISGLVPLIFKACASASNQTFGKSLHAELIKSGIAFHLHTATSLLTMYSKCGKLVDSRKVFDEMPERNVVSWNAMIGGYFKNGDRDSALDLFEKIPIGRNSVTWIEMIDGFAKSGDTSKARQFFDKVPLEFRNVVTWTVMVDGYNANGELEAARKLFEMMPERNFFVWSSMISGYCKRGEVKEARNIFDRIPVRNLVNWNSMISGYAQNGFCEEALEMFKRMQSEGFEPDEVTLTSVLSACAQLGKLDVGKEIYHLIMEKRIKVNQFVLNALLDMHAKCGDLAHARLIFEGISRRTTACWNSMISGFAIHGQSKEAIEFFIKMEESDEIPDEITFLSLLSACAHGGFVDEGLDIFSKMGTYGLVASIKHYGCLVDLLGRAGRLKQAFDLIKRMPMKPNDVVWGALLGACRVHLDTNMVEQVMQELHTLNYDMDSGDYSHYVLLSNIYAASDKWEKAEKMRMAMLTKPERFSMVGFKIIRLLLENIGRICASWMFAGSGRPLMKFMPLILVLLILPLDLMGLLETEQEERRNNPEVAAISMHMPTCFLCSFSLLLLQEFGCLSVTDYCILYLPNEARLMYEKIHSHPNAKVSKKARQFMFSFKVNDSEQVFIEDEANYSLQGAEAEIIKLGGLRGATIVMKELPLLVQGFFGWLLECTAIACLLLGCSFYTGPLTKVATSDRSNPAIHLESYIIIIIIIKCLQLSLEVLGYKVSGIQYTFCYALTVKHPLMVVRTADRNLIVLNLQNPQIFGASNVSKLLNEASLHQKEDALKSLAYELRYGCKIQFMAVLEPFQHPSMEKDQAVAVEELLLLSIKILVFTIPTSGIAAIDTMRVQGVEACDTCLYHDVLGVNACVPY